MLEKLFSNLKPKRVDTITPLHELYDELKDNKKSVIKIILTSIVLGIFMSGLLYQLSMCILQQRSTIYIYSCFIYGILKTWWLSIIIACALCYGSFRVFRSLKRTFRKNYDDNYLKADRETYGGAHFQEEEELKEHFNIYDSINEVSGDVFGTDETGRIYEFNYPNGMNQNQLYCGAPGCGKSAAIIKTKMYQAIKAGKSVIATDTKGALYNETSSVFRHFGYIVRILNLKPSEFKNCDGWNLFAYLKADDPSLSSQCDLIANNLMKNTSNEREDGDYWFKNEFNIVKAAIMHLVTDPGYVKTGRSNLPELLNFFSTNNPRTLKDIFTRYSSDNPIRMCYEIFANCSEQNQGQIVNGLSIRLSKLMDPYLKKALSHDEINPVLPMKKKCIYYINIDDMDDSYRFLSSLFFTDCFNKQCEYSDKLTKQQKEEQLAVDYLCDEYAQTGGILSLENKIASVRSRKIGITLILQDIMQLDTVHGESQATTIKNCCVVKGLLSTNDPITAEYFSDLLGEQTVIVENLRFYEQSTDIIHAKNTLQKTIGEGTRALLLPEEIMNGKLTRNEIIYVISGMPPVRLYKYFSEKSGKAIHPYEKLAQEFGEKMCHLHKPKWRKMEEEKRMQGINGYYSETSNNSSAIPSSTSSKVQNSETIQIKSETNTNFSMPFTYEEEPTPLKTERRKRYDDDSLDLL